MQQLGEGGSSHLRAATVGERWIRGSLSVAAHTYGALMLCLLVGCTASRFSELRPIGDGGLPPTTGRGSEPSPVAPREQMGHPYQIGFPDEIEITVANQ